jgi:hypothetical protein
MFVLPHHKVLLDALLAHLEYKQCDGETPLIKILPVIHLNSAVKPGRSPSTPWDALLAV